MRDLHARRHFSDPLPQCLNIYHPGIIEGSAPSLYKTFSISKNRIVNWSSAMDICTRIKLEGEIKRGCRKGSVFFKNRSYLWALVKSDATMEDQKVDDTRVSILQD